MPYNVGDGVRLKVDHVTHVSAGGKALVYPATARAAGVNYDLLGHFDVDENEISKGGQPQGGGSSYKLAQSHTFTCRPDHRAVVVDVLGGGRYRIRVHVRRLYPKSELP